MPFKDLPCGMAAKRQVVTSDLAVKEYWPPIESNRRIMRAIVVGEDLFSGYFIYMRPVLGHALLLNSFKSA